jgi:hypothetical protein
VSPQSELQEQQDSTSESDLVSALPEALQFEVVPKMTLWETKQTFLCMKTSHALLRANRQTHPQAIVMHYMYIACFSLRRQICLIYSPH